MSLTLPQAAIAEKNALATDAPALWLYEIELPSSPATRIRAVRNTEAVVFRGLTYSPANMVHGETTIDAQGALPSLELRGSNVTRQVMAILELYDGLDGARVDILLVNRVDLASGLAMREERYQVLQSTAGESAFTLQLALFSAFARRFPSRRAQRRHCGFQYRGPRCGYTGALATCDFSETGPNGCEAHDNRERFGGFPLTPRENGIVG